MAELTGKPMEQIVNWFMLLIIFVFDPLAIAMVVAANMAFSQIKDFKPKEEKKEYKVYKKPEAPKEKVIIKEVPIEKEVIKYKETPGLGNLKNQLNHPRVQEAIKHAKRAGEL